MPSIHHVGYVVEDLPRAAERVARRLGAGPFLAMEHIPLTGATYLGRPAVYDHSSCFGRWGDLLLELTQVHHAQPAGLRERLVAPGAGIGHLAWLVDSLPEETARLQSEGLTVFHSGRAGPAHAAWFDGNALLGHPVEVLERRPELLAFYARVRAAADGWDGTQPYRLAGPPPA